MPTSVQRLLIVRKWIVIEKDLLTLPRDCQSRSRPTRSCLILPAVQSGAFLGWVFFQNLRPGVDKVSFLGNSENCRYASRLQESIPALI